MSCERGEALAMDTQPDEQSTQDCWNVVPIHIAKSAQEIHDIDVKYRAELLTSLAQLEKEYPAASSDLLDMSINI